VRFGGALNYWSELSVEIVAGGDALTRLRLLRERRGDPKLC
jgi:hypothetical protein